MSTETTETSEGENFSSEIKVKRGATTEQKKDSLVELKEKFVARIDKAIENDEAFAALYFYELGETIDVSGVKSGSDPLVSIFFDQASNAVRKTAEQL